MAYGEIAIDLAMFIDGVQLPVKVALIFFPDKSAAVTSRTRVEPVPAALSIRNMDAWGQPF